MIATYQINQYGLTSIATTYRQYTALHIHCPRQHDYPKHPDRLISRMNENLSLMKTEILLMHTKTSREKNITVTKLATLAMQVNPAVRKGCNL